MKFRPHRGSLAEALAETVEVEGKSALVEHMQKQLAPWDVSVESERLQITPYGYDKRINWNTYIVVLEGVGVLGFTDGPLD